MKKLLKCILSLSLVGIIVASLTGCRASETKVQKENIIKSEDGKFQISLPSDWKKATNLNELAVIQAANTVAEKYIVVISESTVDLVTEISLEDFAKLAKDNILSGVANSTSTDFEDVTVNGLSGKAFEIQGEVSNVKACYYIVALKGTNHLHQIVTWTLKSKYDKNIEELKQAAQSFKENK